MKISLLTALILSTVLGFSQVTIDAESVLGGSENDVAFDLISTTDGGYLLANYTRSADNDVSENNGLNDFWIVKTDVNGVIEWETSLGGSLDDLARAAVEVDGNYYVAGFSASSDGDVGGNYGGQDGWLVKLDASGNLVWEQNYGGEAADIILDLLATSDGGLLMIGYTQSTTGDLSGSNGLNDLWTLKLSIDGAIEWSENFGGTADEFGSAAVEIPGGYIVASTTFSNDIDVSGNHADTTVTSDFWITRIDDAGALVWQACYGGVWNDNAEDITITADNTVMIAGASKSNDGDVGGHYGESNKWDTWLVEADASGVLLQEKNYGGTRNEYPGAIKMDDDGYIVTGTSESGDNDVTVHYGAAGTTDIWLFKTDASLNLQWQKSLGGTQTDYSEAIIAEGDTTYTLLGYTKSSDTDISFHYGASGNNDVWFVKIIPGEGDTVIVDDSCDVEITVQPVDISTCPDTDVTFTVGGTDSVTSYTWVFVLSGATFTTTEPELNFAGVGATFTTEYYVIATGTCGSDTSDFATFTVGSLDAPSVSPVLPTSLCGVASVEMSTPEIAGYSYQWYYNGTLIPGATEFTYDGTLPGLYYVVVDNGSGCTGTSANVELTSEGGDALITLSGPANICTSGSVTLSTTTGAGYTYQWYKDGAPIAGATASSYTATSIGAYYVIVDAGECTNTSLTINVVDESPVAIATASGDLDICETGNVTLVCSTTGVGFSYQWLRDEAVIPGAITLSLTALDTGSYQIVVTNTFGCDDTSDALVVFTSCPDTTVNPGFNNLNQLLGAQLFPNPASIFVQLNMDIPAALVGSYTCSIFNATGIVNISNPILLSEGKMNMVINLEGMAAGLYFVQLQSEFGVATYPLVVE
jgi:hypothetical protein